MQAYIGVISPAMDSLDCSEKIRHRLLDCPYLSENVCLTDIL